MFLAISALRERLRQSLWFVPTIAVVLSYALSEVAAEVDENFSDSVPGGLVFAGSPDTARALMSTIAASMITFTGLVFSVTMLVLQLAGSQLSPRLMRTFLRDRVTQYTLGVFIATFAYSLLVLRRVSDNLGSGDDVASMSVWIGVALVLASILLFVYYIHHIAQAIRPIHVIRSITSETLSAIENSYGPVDEPQPAASLPEGEPDMVVCIGDGKRGGVFVNIDHKRLCDVALRCGVSMEVLPTPGTFLAPGTPVASVWGDHLPVEKDILRALDTNTERTMQHDPAFGVRQLVDVAVRALSPSLNDPSTASQALDGLHDILARMLTRETSPDQVLSEDPVVILHRPSWDQMLDLAIHEIRHYGADAPQIQRRLQLLLEDLLVRADPVRREAVRRHLLEHATA